MTVRHNGWSRSRPQWKRCTPVAETVLWKPSCQSLGVRTLLPSHRRGRTPSGKSARADARSWRLLPVGARGCTLTKSLPEAAPVVWRASRRRTAPWSGTSLPPDFGNSSCSVAGLQAMHPTQAATPVTDASVTRAVGLSRVAVWVAIAVVIAAVVALITFVIPIPIVSSAVFTALRIAIHRIGDAAGQANQSSRKCNQ